jgi:hypothetical protein
VLSAFISLSGGQTSFNVQFIADYFSLVGYYHWLGRRIGVEPPFGRLAFLYLLGGRPAVQVAAGIGYFVEDVFGVAFYYR